jgi:FkbM family methyltransferase
VNSIIHALVTQFPRSWMEHLERISLHTPGLKRLRSRFASSLKGRDGIVMSGPAKGLPFNPGQSDSRFLLGTFEPALQYLIDRCLNPGEAFYDVGANVGFLSVLAARRVGPQGQVHCFEPLPANADQIRHNAQLGGLRQVSVHQIALANSQGMAKFRVSTVPTFGALEGSPMAVDQQVSTIEVPVSTLDHVVKHLRLPKPAMVKIDIEGSEADFLTGAEETIREHRPILLIELHGTNKEVASFLRGAAYVADVVGGGAVLDAPWAALLAASPCESKETRARVASICQSFTGR